MSELISGTPCALVYIGGKALFTFETTQKAWDYLMGLSETADDSAPYSWPSEVYIAFVISDGQDSVWVPQVGKVIKHKELKYQGLFGLPYEIFCQKVVNDWPTIYEGLRNGK